MPDYNSTNTGAVIDTAVDAVELAQAATSTDATTNRLLKLADFGLGSNSAPVISDFTLAVRSGHYRCLLSTAVGGPDSEAYNASVLVQNGISGSGSTFVVTRSTSSTTAQAIYFGSRSSSSGTVVWAELFTSINSVNPLSFGVGGVTSTFTDWNTIPLNFGGFLTVGSGAANVPAGLPDTFYTLMRGKIPTSY